MSDIFLTEELWNFPKVRFLKKFLIGHPGIIAGGCFKSIFTDEKVHDIDMFFRNSSDYHTTVNYFKSRPEEYALGYENKNVQSFVHKDSQIRIECIRKIFGSPEDILKQFDFTIAKFAYEIEAEPADMGEDGETEWTYTDTILYHKQFFEHLCHKRLVVDDAMPYPVSTFNRTYKYAQSGFFPCRETKQKIIRAIREMPMTDEDALAEAMYEGHD